MKPPRGFSVLGGIFGRTFLLTLAALFVAVAVGIALLITRPPMHNAPVRLSEIARQLSGGEWRPGPPPGARGLRIRKPRTAARATDRGATAGTQ